ncbi:unnamed protein product [Dracunculus medinensis]|uniref:Anaphase-promoting complex subunit 2 n=1 Tax=Dracunculus medinensis TaxID=318479 RepID=A0A3P7SJ14_DRAME|nr:unnamed protein product [Dracunculus medinensis]
MILIFDFLIFRVKNLSLENAESYRNYKKYIYSSRHEKAVFDKTLGKSSDIEEIARLTRNADELEFLNEENYVELEGLLLVKDFLNKEVEEFLIKKIDRKEWTLSQSGRRKQDYGPQVNFKHKKIKVDRFSGMPDYIDIILNRMKEVSPNRLGEYQPFELCNLEYVDERLSAIEMHFDDSWIWGNRLICLNLLNPCVLSYANDERQLLVYVYLPRRSLVCMAGKVRHEWRHAVFSEHIRGRRIALTMREPSPLFQVYDLNVSSDIVIYTNTMEHYNFQEHIVNVIRPRFVHLLDKMKSEKSANLLEAMFVLINSTYRAVNQEIKSDRSGQVDENSPFAVSWHFVPYSLFCSEVTLKMTFLLNECFKFTYSIFESILKDKRISESLRHKADLLDKALGINNLLTDSQAFNVSLKIVNISLKHASFSIISDFTERLCTDPSKSNLLKSLKKKINCMQKWAKIIGLDKYFNSLFPSLKVFLEKKIVDQLNERVCFFLFFLTIAITIRIQYCRLQAYELVIKSYPASGNIIDDMRFCMESNGGYGRENLVEKLSNDVKTYLLHIGVSTVDILQGYANAVECLRRLDPTCVIMQKICSIIRTYIKQRPDTVRCIITYITGEMREELSQQLTRKRTAFIDEENLQGINDELIANEEESEEEQWMNWLPDPPDAIINQSRRFRQNADVFNMLVSVYGSKELFVKEYRHTLAERLTKSWNRDVKPIFEMRYLDLLKLRFSEGELQHCDVMLKDMRDSERMDYIVFNKLVRFINFSNFFSFLIYSNTISVDNFNILLIFSFQIHQNSSNFPISARIISTFFWPKIDNEQFELPIEMISGLASYGRAYEAQKGSRKLDWMTGVGSVEMEIHLDGLITTINVSPAHTAVLAQFTKKEQWSLDELSVTLGMEKRSTKKRLEWWQNSGIIVYSAKQSNGEREKWCLATWNSKMDRLRGEIDVESDESEDEKLEDSVAVDALEQYWTYTRSFIASQEPIKAERLHSIFKMLASPGQQGPSLEIVISFLQRKVKLNLLSCVNGLYKVVKD